MDPIWLSIAFIFGFLVRLIGLPPLVGYLIAGFTLKYFGAESGDFVDIVSELGVTLLLFTIGLKLNFKDLIKKEIWGGTSIQMLTTTLILGIFIWGLSFASISIFSDFSPTIAFLIAFALSFSSTVYAVKSLEEKGEVRSSHGTLSIGILIMQDIMAVLFIVFATGEIPNIYALGLPLILLLLRPVLMLILNRIGHGELLVLYGFFLSLIIGAELFNFVGLKGDLGALVIGMMMAGHRKSKEMADILLHFKDFFLIGFFLSIGLMGSPSTEMFILAIILAFAVNFKVIIYFVVLTRFRLRARTSLFTSLTLANFSEFGLIVASFAVSAALIPSSWLVTMAIALSITFIISAPLNSRSHSIYYAIKKWLHVFETSKRLLYDRTFDIGNAEILIFGMGKLGTSVYEQLNSKYGQRVLGLDYDLEVVQKHRDSGKTVIQDDATDIEFWENIVQNPLHYQQVKMVMLCMNDHQSNLFAINRLKSIQFDGIIAAIARFEDERQELEEAGADAAYNIYSEAGIGFADHVCINLNMDKESC